MNSVFSEQGPVGAEKVGQITWELCVNLHQKTITERRWWWNDWTILGLVVDGVRSFPT